MPTRPTNRPAFDSRRLLLAAIAAAATCVAYGADPHAQPPSDPEAAPLTAVGRSGFLTPAKIAKAGRLAYPGDSDSSGQDALVYHRVCITAEGRIRSLELLPEGFHAPPFVREAERYLRSLVFEPATLDGQPIESCPVVPIRFVVGARLEARKGVTTEFRKELEEVTRLITSGDLAGAQHHTDYMLRDKVKLLYEYAVLQARLAETYARAGNAHRAIESARSASGRSGMPFPKVMPGEPLPSNDIRQYLLQKEWIVELLTMRVRLAASNGLLAEALQAHYELASLVGPRPDAELVKQGEILEGALQSRKELAGKIIIGETGRWDHLLLYPDFTVSEVNGTIRALELRCGPNVRVLEFAPDAEWRIPGSWEECRLEVNAEPGTALTVYEFPRDTALPQP